MSEELQKIAVFQRKEIHKQIHNGEWWFVINDIITVLAESDNPSQYLRNLRNRDEGLSKLFAPVDKGGVQIEPLLALPFNISGGRQNLLAWITEGIFRLIQSIPSKKAEPFKRWLAKTGYERVQEIEDPEIARTDNIQGMGQNKDAAKRGGAVAGTARKQLEKETGQNVISDDNYLPDNQNKEISK